MGVERGPCRAADRKLSFALHADAVRRWCLLQKGGTSWCHVIVLGIFFPFRRACFCFLPADDGRAISCWEVVAVGNATCGAGLGYPSDPAAPGCFDPRG
jgi:hypothetical protein